MSKNQQLTMHQSPVNKKKSWAEMADDADEEERIDREEEAREITKKFVEHRKYLLSIGQYELEDGEILE